ncbi:MAG: hypothetical protein DME83_06985 [Verrucomicrobia bacterium]|nr:MAG: hypothetical protein DME83_06985 [Verrucomicrobiota bacterium]
MPAPAFTRKSDAEAGCSRETLERGWLLETVAKRITNYPAVTITLGLVEVWRDIEADVYP